MSVVRPSCRKKSRWPTPHSGAVRNSFPVAVPWETLSARSVPMLCTAKSEKRFAVAKFSPEVRDDAVVGSDLVWHASQWMLLNRELPFAMDLAPPGFVVDGVGGARKRMKFTNFWMSLTSAVPVWLKFRWSSGVALNMQFSMSL